MRKFRSPPKKKESNGKEQRMPTAMKFQKRRVLLVDDHPTMREGLVRVIEREDDLMVCGQASSIHLALEMIESSKPDIGVVDLSLAGQNGIDLIKDIKVRHPGLPVLVHTMHDESVYAERSLRAGAKGYINKAEPPEMLLKAIRSVLHGDIYLSETATKDLLHAIAEDQPGRRKSPVHGLSDREFQVFELIGRGLGTKEIADSLYLSAKTVQAHRDHVRQKLNLKDGSDLMRFAIQWAAAQS
jgi:DNA-binding NarL/FixJ family response regulator